MKWAYETATDIEMAAAVQLRKFLRDNGVQHGSIKYTAEWAGELRSEAGRKSLRGEATVQVGRVRYYCTVYAHGGAAIGQENEAGQHRRLAES